MRIALTAFAKSILLSKRLGFPYQSGRSRDWIKSKTPAAPAVKREAEEDWAKKDGLDPLVRNEFGDLGGLPPSCSPQISQRRSTRTAMEFLSFGIAAISGDAIR